MYVGWLAGWRKMWVRVGAFCVRALTTWLRNVYIGRYIKLCWKCVYISVWWLLPTPAAHFECCNALHLDRYTQTHTHTHMNMCTNAVTLSISLPWFFLLFFRFISFNKIFIYKNIINFVMCNCAYCALTHMHTCTRVCACNFSNVFINTRFKMIGRRRCLRLLYVSIDVCEPYWNDSMHCGA